MLSKSKANFLKARAKFNENTINNREPHGQIGNGETPGAEYLNENDSEDIKQTKLLQFLTLCYRY